jgi:hypothetical protein
MMALTQELSTVPFLLPANLCNSRPKDLLVLAATHHHPHPNYFAVISDVSGMSNNNIYSLLIEVHVHLVTSY